MIRVFLCCMAAFFLAANNESAAQSESEFSQEMLEKIQRLTKETAANFRCQRFAEIARLWNEDTMITRESERNHWRNGVEAARAHWLMFFPVLKASDEAGAKMMMEMNLTADYFAGAQSVEHHSEAEEAVESRRTEGLLLPQESMIAEQLYESSNCQLLLLQ